MASGQQHLGVDKAVLDSARGPDGKLYFVPSGVFYFTMLVNRTVIDKAGMQMPPDNWSWDDFAKFVQELQPKLAKGVHATGNMGNEFDAFTNWVQGRGEALFKKDGSIGVSKQTIVDYFNFWERLRNGGDTELIDQTAEIPNTLIDQTLLAKGDLVFDRTASQSARRASEGAERGPSQRRAGAAYLSARSRRAGQRYRLKRLRDRRQLQRQRQPDCRCLVQLLPREPKAAQIYSSDNGVVSVDRFRQEQGNDKQASEGLRELVQLFAKVAPTAKAAYSPSGGYKAMLQALQDSYQSVAFGKASPDSAASAMLAEVKRLMR